MAQKDRSFTADVALFSIAPVVAGVPGTYVSYLGTLRDCEVTRDFEEKEARAAKDLGQYLVAGVEKFTIRGSFVVEATAVMLANCGTRVAVEVKETATGMTYTGQGLLNPASHRFAENGAQTEEVTIKGTTLTHA